MDPTTRSDAIDFVKGFLVLAMVGFHALNYFVDGMPRIYGYVYYVGPAFIFFSGIVCGTIYFDKFKRDRKYVSLRLLVRSMKLAALFLGLNILINVLFSENYGGRRLGLDLILDNLGSVFLNGNPPLMAFEILLPIAYVLLLSVLLLRFAGHKYLNYILLISVICALTIRRVEMVYNLYYGLFGVAGVYAGLICTELAPKLRSRITGLTVATILLLYLVFLIPEWGHIRRHLLLYFMYVAVVVAAAYLLGRFLGSGRLLSRIVVRLGRYSLYLYIAQIFFLQILYRLGVSRTKFEPAKIFVVVVSVSCLLAALSYATDFIRGRFSIADRIYRFIFA